MSGSDLVELEVDFNNGKGRELPMSTFVDSLFYIPLDAENGPLIGSVRKVFFAGDDLIAWDSQLREIHRFDRRGNWKNTISRRGRGPGEYLEIEEVMIDTLNRNILVYDLLSRRLLFYDYAGVHLRSIDDFKFSRTLINLPNGGYLGYLPDHSPAEPSHGEGFWLADSLGGLSKYFPLHDFVHPSLSPIILMNFYNLPDGLIGFSPLEELADYVYDYRSDSLYRKRVYHVNGPTIPDLAGMYDEEFIAKDEKATTRYFNQEKGNFVLSQWYDIEADSYYTLLDKTTGIQQIYDAINPALTNGQEVLPTFIYPESGQRGMSVVDSNLTDRIITVMNPGLLEQIEELPDLASKIPPELVMYMQGHEEINPVLQVLLVK
jgi:hypothetical protein